MERQNPGDSTTERKNIVITGGSKGIGKALAVAFARENAAVYICARNEVSLYHTIAEIQASFPGALVKGQPADLSDTAGVHLFGNWVLEEIKATTSGRIDVLVNNAGTFTPGNIYDETAGALETMMAGNLYSAYHLTRHLIQHMIAARQGHIFNMCSIASLDAYPNGGSYGISKYALLGFSKNLREELKQHHIKVTAILPGAVMSDSWSGFDNSTGRIMEATDIATMVVATTKLSPQAVVEDIIFRPMLGDLP
ncbi:MAG: SDR family oxidoreductase [Ferruginibacter sp.]|nr:SDR family oxidoreductase [Ferruginibacter sp.]